MSTRGPALIGALLQRPARPPCPRRRAGHLGAAAVAVASGRRSTPGRRAGRPGRPPGRSRARGRARRPGARAVGRLRVDVDRASRAPNLAALIIASRAAATTASPAASSARSPTTTTSTGTPCALLDLGGGRLQRAPPAPPPRRGRGGPASHARSSRSWRRARAATSCGSLARALDQRQRLEHRVVQVGRHLGALLRADALGALVRQGAHQPRIQGARITPSTTTATTHGQQHVARRAQRAGGLEERDAGSDHQRDAQPGAGDRDGSPLDRLDGGALGLVAAPRRRRGRLGLAPDERAAAGDEDERPRHRVREPDSQPAEGEQDAEQQQPRAQRHLDGGATGGQPPARRRGRVARGDHQPAERVERDAQPARRGGHHEGEAHQHGVDAEAPPDPRAHAAEPPLGAVAAQEPELRACRGGGHASHHRASVATVQAVREQDGARRGTRGGRQQRERERDRPDGIGEEQDRRGRSPRFRRPPRRGRA